MKIVVLGASGATGRQVVDQAVAGGHDVVAYVRRPDAVTPRAGVHVVEGSIDDVAALTKAMTGAEAVISCLGPSLNPQLLVSVDLFQRAVPAVIAAMKRAEVPRFVLLSAFGVGATKQRASLVARLMYETVVRAANADKEQAEQVLAASGLEWTIVYPVTLTNGPATRSPTVVPVDELGPVSGLPRVSRADVAAVLLDAAVNPSGGNRRLFVR